MRVGALTLGVAENRRHGSRARASSVVMLGLFALLAAACSEDPTSGPTAADYKAERERLLAQMKKSGGGAQAPVAVVPDAVAEGESVLGGFGTVASTYAYDSRGNRDPFEAYRHRSGDGDESIQTPLMAYELGQLSVVAVVWNTGNRRALVSDPRGETHLVKEGSPIGKNDGLVIHIGDNMVLVKETYVDFAGEMTTKDVELRIQRSQGG
jgi:hypothetical protein